MVKVPDYNYDFRLARSLVNPHFDLKNFELLLQKFDDDSEEDKSQDVARAKAHAQVFLEFLPRYIAKYKLSDFFEELLQTFRAGPKEQKLLEKGAQEFRKVKVRRTRDPVGAVAKKRDFYEQLYKAAKKVIDRGDPLDSGEPLKAGGFTIVNTGGFNEKVMEEAQKVIEEASRLVQAKGLGKVCYGDVNVAGTTMKARALAHYSLTTDELFIRANLKGSKGPAVRTVIHELGHRLQNKFLSGKKKEIRALYYLLGRESNSKLEGIKWDKSKWPKEGDIIEYNGERQKVMDVTPNRRYEYEIHTMDVHDRRWKIPMVAYLRDTYNTSSFVTLYAAKDPDENFAEMVSFYCLNELPPDQVKMLEDIL